jgi:hypothetical protein
MISEKNAHLFLSTNCSKVDHAIVVFIAKINIIVDHFVDHLMVDIHAFF